MLTDSFTFSTNALSRFARKTFHAGIRPGGGFYTKNFIVLRSGKTDPFIPFMCSTIRTNIIHTSNRCSFITKSYGLNEINI